MVVAGVYMVARTYPVFVASGTALHVVTAIGTITLVIAGLLAFVQDDIKRVLAYSTVSQLGYMIAGLGVGAWTGAVFHLFTHAFFKALLFLGSGSVIHACHTNNMSEMGGLRKYMPTTFRTFIIGSVALAGIPPLAGFWSKDDILGEAFHNHSYGMWAFGTIGALLTAAYMTRACYLTFWGEYRGHGHPHESPPSMAVPLVLLAIPSVVIGFIGTPIPGIKNGFGTWVTQLGEAEAAQFRALPAGLSVLIALVGVAAGYVIYHEWRDRRIDIRANPAGRFVHTLLNERYYLDWLYFNGIIHPVSRQFARASNWVNQNVIDGIVNGVGRVMSAYVSRGTYWVDQTIVDNIYNGSAAGTSEAGGMLRYIQSGRVQQYAAILFGGVALGTVVLIVFLV